MKRAFVFAAFALALVPSLAAAQYVPYTYTPPPPYRATVDVTEDTGEQSRYSMTVRPLSDTSARVRTWSWEDGSLNTATVRQRGPNRVSVYDWNTGDYSTYRVRPMTSPSPAPTYSIYDYDSGDYSRVRVRPRR